jgi:phospholipase C
MKPTHRWLLAALAVWAVTFGMPRRAWTQDDGDTHTDTPIKHVVVIFQENISFDHYFGTYPKATNPAGEPVFHASSSTPSVNGLFSGGLLTNNPNSANPFRLDRAQAVTCDQNHDYMPEQQAFNGGLMNKFVQFLNVGGPGCLDYGFGLKLVMGYYDGNTVTALWQYAQHFAMSDNSYGTGFGPSTPGAINLISGQTHGIDPVHQTGNNSGNIADGSVIGDPDPFFDDCGSPSQLAMTGTNIGNLLSAQDITWGWFQGGFTPTTPATANSPAVCASATQQVAPGGKLQRDYSAHHEPFQYYQSTANPHHLPPTSVALIGHDDQANHQYDLSSFWAAVDAGNMPAVSFLKAVRAQDGHANNSDPLDEQLFLVSTINHLQSTAEWNETAVVILYDDSDGWYDHVMGPIVSQSSTPQDALIGPGNCGTTPAGGFGGRCGYGPRMPLLVISPWARVNFVDHSVTDQTSIISFIEDNWDLSRIGGQSLDEKAGALWNMFDFSRKHKADKLFLDPTTGEPLPGSGSE